MGSLELSQAFLASVRRIYYPKPDERRTWARWSSGRLSYNQCATLYFALHIHLYRSQSLTNKALHKICTHNHLPFTLDEYLNKRQLLQSPSEQSRLLLEVPKVIAEEIEQEATLQEGTNGSPRSILGGASEISTSDLEVNPTLSTQKFGNADAAGSADILTASIVVSCYSFLARDESKDFASEDASIEVPKADENNAEGQPVQFVQKMTPQINLEEPKVIELSNDDDYNDREDGDSFGRSIWHYMDSQGNAQGPFPVESLKRWSDANYFPPGLKVWKTGQSHEEAVLLSHVLLQMFHDSYE